MALMNGSDERLRQMAPANAPTNSDEQLQQMARTDGSERRLRQTTPTWRRHIRRLGKEMKEWREVAIRISANATTYHSISHVLTNWVKKGGGDVTENLLMYDGEG